MEPDHKPSRLAWARFNAYGILVAVLALLGLADLTNPGGTELARLVGEVPPGQPFWVAGYAVSGVLLLLGFARTDRLAETAGLCLLIGCLTVQTYVAWRLLGVTTYTQVRLAIILVVGLTAAARVSVLWSKAGLVITIPARGKK